MRAYPFFLGFFSTRTISYSVVVEGVYTVEVKPRVVLPDVKALFTCRGAQMRTTVYAEDVE